MRFLAIALVLVGLAGCSRVDKFDISVRNETAAPLTVVLTKDGPPFESKWAAPEDLAIESPKATEEHGFVVLPPGREADVAVEGRFERATRGVLRVYRGELDISTMNAIAPSSADRLDVELRPGANRFVIADRDGRLKNVKKRDAHDDAEMSVYDEHQRAAERIAARCAILTLSDTRSPKTDKSGSRIRELLQADGHTVAGYQVIPDDSEQLRNHLHALLSRDDVDAVITNGGTGISRRDNTIPVVEKTLDVSIPGFGELFRMLSWNEVGSGAMLSRALGGIARGKLLFALPGSTNAVELAMIKLILPEMRHLLRELRK